MDESQRAVAGQGAGTLEDMKCLAKHNFVMRRRDQLHVQVALDSKENHKTNAEEDDDEESEGEHDEEDGDRYHHHPRGFDVDYQSKDDGEVQDAHQQPRAPPANVPSSVR